MRRPGPAGAVVLRGGYRGCGLLRISPAHSEAGQVTLDITTRELEVADLVVLGLANKEIARRLGLTVGTVKMHLHSIYQKLQIGSRMQLAAIMRDANELLDQELRHA